MRRLAVLLALAVAMLTPAAHAQAAQPGASYSLWTIEGSRVRVRFVVPSSEAALFAAAGAPTPGLDTISAAVGQGLAVSSRAGDCEAIDQGEGVGQVYTLALTPGLDRFEMIFDCPGAEGIVLQDHLLFDRAPHHVDYARVQVDGAAPRLATFTAQQQSLSVSGASAPAGGGFVAFAARAFRATILRPEALCVVVGLFLLAPGLVELGWAGAALAFGYLISLAMALLGLQAPNAGLAAGAVGLLAAGLGLSAMRMQADVSGFAKRRWIMIAGCALLVATAVAIAWPKGYAAMSVAGGLVLFALAQAWLAKAPAAWLALLPAAAFGVLDELSPASDMAMLRLPAATAAPALAGRDLGALAALALAGVALAVLRRLARRLQGLRAPLADVAAAALIGLGLFWFVSGVNS